MDKDLQYRLYSLIHLLSKKILKNKSLPGTNCIFKFKSADLGITEDSAIKLWSDFIRNSIIRDQSPFSGFHYAGFILEREYWILPSWIWTNAALVKVMLSIGEKETAENLGSLIASRQETCGGWIVRFDYDENGPIPMLAPNDSAYIANNAFLSLYTYTGNKKYLDIAEKCARWIMSTCRNDGIVYTGYNMRDKVWDEKAVIVDVGFTAALFANLFIVTHDEEYKIFLNKFIHRYTNLFFNNNFSGFSTSIDNHNNQQGGFFGRGQAWALEGLIPSYNVLKDPELEIIIEKTINRLLNSQNSDGSWAYNLSRRMMGNDCKGVPVIAKSLADWYCFKQNPLVLHSIEKAFEWCCKHTKRSGEGKGGIYSFCTEGAIVRNLYSSCAFVYSSAYAIEIAQFLANR